MKSLRSLLVLIAAVPLFAQQPVEETPEPRPRQIRNTLELQYYNFGNFFQAPAGQRERSVGVLGAAYRAFWTRPENQPDLYGRVSVLRYSGGASETSYTGQLGVSKYGSVHWYDVYLEHTVNGYALEIDETRASADITSLRGYYSYRLTDDWRAGVEATLEQQRFGDQDDFENDYRSLGVEVRYRGFGDLFQPRVGYVTGERDVNNDVDSYDDRYWYVQLTTRPDPRFTASLRYRDRTRDYTSIARTDDRDQWLLRGEFRQNDRLTWLASYLHEQTDSTDPRRGSFDRNVFFAGMNVGF